MNGLILFYFLFILRGFSDCQEMGLHGGRAQSQVHQNQKLHLFFRSTQKDNLDNLDNLDYLTISIHSN